MITETSKLAYKQLNEEGIGDTQKSKILYVVREHYKNSDKGLSLREISNLTNFEINAVSGRVNDLKKDGLLETTDKRKCSYTKRLVSPVIPRKEDSILYKELQSKIKLLMGIYGYDKNKITFKNNVNSKYFTMQYGYWNKISDDDIQKIRENSNSLITEHYWEDDDTGDNFSYIVKGV
tara:strand:+ start:80 stop:613 length:534 start_codon:yes stop_codon:yes gene_type:complete